MREILFRGKRVDDGEWVEGFYGQFHNRPTIKEPNIHQIFVLFTEEEERGNEGHFFSAIGGLWHTIKPETLGQYTGLTDKNGTKIFEGDILQFDYIGKNLGVNGIAIVSFQNGKFGVEWGYHKEFVCIDGFANTTLEVVGNIHDNPELLKGGADNG